MLGGGSVAGPTTEDMKLCWPLFYATKGDDTGGKRGCTTVPRAQ